ncbi:MAG: hypothetical protein ABI411_12040 [Tahibacter sp.]
MNRLASARGLLLFALFNVQLVGVAGAAESSASESWKKQQRVAAEKSEGILKQADRVRGLLGQYQLMLAAYKADESKAFRLIFGQYLSWHQTYVGLYDEAVESFSIKQEADKQDAPSPLEGGQYSAQPAVDAIAKLAHGRRAIFFNEAHNAAITRSLTVQMLGKLREDGYTWFAAETLYETDTALTKRGYPIDKSGFYTQEPVYADMIRSALKLGFKVVSYEAMSDATGDGREREQARNLYERVFKTDPQARLVVNAGYAHIVESGKYLGGASMAQHFRKLSDIDPLTIEQTMLIEHPQPNQDHPIYRAVVASHNPSVPTVFIDKMGKPWSLRPAGYDVSVLFPASPHDPKNRPAWLSLGGLRKSYAIGGEICRGELPCLIEARYPDEDDDAIPADRTVLGLADPHASEDEHKFVSASRLRGELYLRPGRYRVRGVNSENHALTSQNITVSASNSP